VTDDDRIDVNICEPMDGQEVGLEEPFQTGDGAASATPRRIGLSLLHEATIQDMSTPELHDLIFSKGSARK
jgi:hypothetical protein